MAPLLSAIHLLSFVAPAFFVVLGLALFAPLILPGMRRGKARWLGLALNFGVGSAVLFAGLWYFGRDGKMATYAALVLATGTVQWLTGRGWRAKP